MARTIGIDLGTTNSAAVVLKDGRIQIVPATEGPTTYGKMFPSIVAFKEDGEVVVGKDAKGYAYVHPQRTVRWIKRKMGTDYTVTIDGHAYSPQEISALILKKIKRDAETYLGAEIDKAVITVPAYFNNNQRNATKRAGELAGFDVLRIINEPTASCLAYGLDRLGRNIRVAVLDLGAGTFDVTILELRKGVFKVISTSGDTALGGKDMDDAILEYLAAEIEGKHGVNVMNDLVNLNLLRDTGELARIHLSTEERVAIKPNLNVGEACFIPEIVLTRRKLRELIEPVLRKLHHPMERAIEDSGLSTQDIDRLILVGGPTRMPVVRECFQSFFHIAPEDGIDPMNIVAMGAFIQASVLEGEIKDLLLLDVTPLSLGVETSGGVDTRLIKRNTIIPAQESMIFTTEEDTQTSMMIHVLQGERAMAKDNISLGLFKLDGIPPAPRYEQDVEITFSIDADGILDVSAEIIETGKQKSIKVTGLKDLSVDEITRMIIEETKFDEVDRRRRELAEARKHAEAVIYGTKESLKKIRNEIPEKDEKSLVKTLEWLKFSVERGEVQKIKQYTEELLELAKGLTLKLKKIDEAKALVSSTRKRIRETIPRRENQLLEDMVRRMEEALPQDIDMEMSRLKEFVVLLEADHSRVE